MEIKINLIPDNSAIMEQRERINERLAEMLNRDHYIKTVEEIAAHHMAIDSRMELLENIAVNAQQEAIKNSGLLARLKENYNLLNERFQEEVKVSIARLKWILKARQDNSMMVV